jgi:hypothetical protein
VASTCCVVLWCLRWLYYVFLLGSVEWLLVCCWRAGALLSCDCVVAGSGAAALQAVLALVGSMLPHTGAPAPAIAPTCYHVLQPFPNHRMQAVWTMSST